MRGRQTAKHLRKRLAYEKVGKYQTSGRLTYQKEKEKQNQKNLQHKFKGKKLQNYQGYIAYINLFTVEKQLSHIVIISTKDITCP